MNASRMSGALLLAAFAGHASADEDRLDLVLGLGSVLSSDYHSLLEEHFEMVEGGLGWGSLELGLSFRATPRLRIEPGVDYLVSVGQSVGGSDFTNSIVLTGVEVTFALGQEQRGWYFGVEAFDVSPESELPGLEFESGGLGGGVHFGYDVGAATFELGARRVPVEVHSGSETESRDFGGVTIGVSVRL